MTNKQTIDGVSRELLEEMLSAMKEMHSLPQKYYGSTLGDRVRNILENLNAQSSPAAIGTLHRDCDERIIFESLGEIHIKDRMQVYAEPAAQHQAGEDRAVSLAMTREMRLYIAGPMTGLPEFNFPAFNAMAEKMRGTGWHVENPAEHGHVDGAEWADYLRYDIGRLATCEAIMLLPGWSKSRGARLEVSIAKELGMVFMFAEGAEHEPAAQPQGEIERLKEWGKANQGLAQTCMDEVEALRAQLAERDSALREIADLDPRGEFLGWQLDGKIDAFLSTSAEPKPRGEPVAWIKEHWSGKYADFHYKSLTDVVFKEDWKPLYAEQPAPLADEAAKAFAKGFNTLEAGGGKYRINMQFQSREDAWGAFNVLARLKQLNTPQ